MNMSLAVAAAAFVAALPVTSAHAHGNIAIRIDTPEFGIRIGAPAPAYPPPVMVAPVYAPVIYLPLPVIHAPSPRVLLPAPIYDHAPPVYFPSGHDRKHYKIKHDRGRSRFDG